MPLRLDPELYALVHFYSVPKNLDPYLVLGVIAVESAFDPCAIGDNGDSFGLMQLNRYGAGAGYAPAQLLDPETNIMLGTAFLAWCKAELGDETAAVSAYNQGVNGYRANGPSVNQAYVDAVLHRRKLLEDAGLTLRRGPAALGEWQ